jgi:hypothetical protein
MSGPPPKPAHLRQRQNRKHGAGTIEAPKKPHVPTIPNPDGREWHALTVSDWELWWESPMASRWLPSDVSALGLLAVLMDNAYKDPQNAMKYAPEIRLQRQCFGLTPLDLSRLQWEVARGEDAEKKRAPTATKHGSDLRKVLKMVNG